jgi:hypothetical protein
MSAVQFGLRPKLKTIRPGLSPEIIKRNSLQLLAHPRPHSLGSIRRCCSCICSHSWHEVGDSKLATSSSGLAPCSARVISCVPRDPPQVKQVRAMDALG